MTILSLTIFNKSKWAVIQRPKRRSHIGNFTYFKQFQTRMCFSRTGLEKELLNESCYVLKHALIHKCRALQNGSRELQPTKSSSEFVLSVYTATFLHWRCALTGASNSCAHTERQEHPHQHSCTRLKSSGWPPARTAIISIHNLWRLFCTANTAYQVLNICNSLAGTSTILDFTASQETFVDTNIDFSEFKRSWQS